MKVQVEATDLRFVLEGLDSFGSKDSKVQLSRCSIEGNRLWAALGIEVKEES